MIWCAKHWAYTTWHKQGKKETKRDFPYHIANENLTKYAETEQSWVLGRLCEDTNWLEHKNGEMVKQIYIFVKVFYTWGRYAITCDSKVRHLQGYQLYFLGS